jgi:hypothetical protein
MRYNGKLVQIDKIRACAKRLKTQPSFTIIGFFGQKITNLAVLPNNHSPYLRQEFVGCSQRQRHGYAQYEIYAW